MPPPPKGMPQLPPGPPPLPPAGMPLGKGVKSRQLITGLTGQPFGQRLDKLAGTKSCVLIGTMDGGLGMMLPVEERTYRRLALLQQIMSMGVPTPCALNPRYVRTYLRT
jgi:hypothetical protein